MFPTISLVVLSLMVPCQLKTKGGACNGLPAFIISECLFACPACCKCLCAMSSLFEQHCNSLVQYWLFQTFHSPVQSTNPKCSQTLIELKLQGRGIMLLGTEPWMLGPYHLDVFISPEFPSRIFGTYVMLHFGTALFNAVAYAHQFKPRHHPIVFRIQLCLLQNLRLFCYKEHKQFQAGLSQ